MDKDKLKALTAQEILAIKPDNPEQLFTQDNMMEELSLLRRQWHPDRNTSSDAKDVFQHVEILFHEAEMRKELGTWRGAACIRVETNKGFLKFNYVAIHEFELGKMYIGRKKVLFIIERASPEHERLFDRGCWVLGNLRFANDKMREDFARYFPKPDLISKHSQHEPMCLMFDKTDEVACLADLLEKFGGKLEPRHVAWVISRLLNIAMFLQYNQISHQAITLQTCFVSGPMHQMLLYGGWWYNAKIGEPVKNVLGELKPFFPAALLTEKRANLNTDRSLIGALGFQLLGDTTGTGMALRKDSTIPEPMIRTLSSLGYFDDGLEAMKAWKDCLFECFGQRRFIELPGSHASEIYNH